MKRIIMRGVQMHLLQKKIKYHNIKDVTVLFFDCLYVDNETVRSEDTEEDTNYEVA